MRSPVRGFLVEPFEPAYLAPGVRASLRERSASALESLRACRTCPRDCRADRAAGRAGLCGVGRHARVSSAFAHHGEEQPLRGWGGSGTIFFSGCNLRCVFCQNADISQHPAGEEVAADEIARLALGLQAAGCHNINFVTPEHVVPQVIEAVAVAVERGLAVPIVYNTSAYDSVDSLRRLDGLVDIYMPDFKVWTPRSGRRYLAASDYGERARAAIAEMHRQVGDLRFGPDGIARRGLLVRHLVMPGLIEESREILAWLAAQVSPDTYVNIMAQYRPANRVGRRKRAGRGVRDTIEFEEVNRLPTRDEIAAVYEAAEAVGLWRFDERAPLP